MISHTIWKAILKPIEHQDIQMPQGAEILTAHEQFGELCIWFRCDPNKPLINRHIVICGTGRSIQEKMKYIGTGFLHSGNLVLHVFEYLY